MSISLPMKVFREFPGGPLELHVARFTWDRGTVGDGTGYSSKLSIKLQLVPQDLWVGAFWKRDRHAVTLWLCLVPCLPIRVKLVRSYGGRFP